MSRVLSCVNKLCWIPRYHWLWNSIILIISTIELVLPLSMMPPYPLSDRCTFWHIWNISTIIHPQLPIMIQFDISTLDIVFHHFASWNMMALFTTIEALSFYLLVSMPCTWPPFWNGSRLSYFDTHVGIILNNWFFASTIYI